jgi:hypothetical protein
MIASLPIEIQTEDLQNKKQEFLSIYRDGGYIDRNKNVPYMP